jgi:hypothetical protein
LSLIVEETMEVGPVSSSSRVFGVEIGESEEVLEVALTRRYYASAELKDLDMTDVTKESIQTTPNEHNGKTERRPDTWPWQHPSEARVKAMVDGKLRRLRHAGGCRSWVTTNLLVMRRCWSFVMTTLTKQFSAPSSERRNNAAQSARGRGPTSESHADGSVSLRTSVFEIRK